MNPRLLIFTDLDGSLLDHHSYGHSAAAPMLERLRRLEVPVIPTSSKTRAELMVLRETLVNDHPFIIENGAAVLIPDGYFGRSPDGATLTDGYWVKTFCAPRQHWLKLVLRQQETHPGEFITFAESSVKQIREMTGLNAISAEKAALREYGEPVRWLAGAARRVAFVEALEREGAKVLTGGRFLHVSGDSDKGKALRWLQAQYQRQNDADTFYTIAIGDSQNDVAMLETADYALIVRSRVHAPPKLSRAGPLLVSEKFGPEGWQEGLQTIFNSLPIDPKG